MNSLWAPTRRKEEKSRLNARFVVHVGEGAIGAVGAAVGEPLKSQVVAEPFTFRVPQVGTHETAFTPVPDRPGSQNGGPAEDCYSDKVIEGAAGVQHRHQAPYWPQYAVDLFLGGGDIWNVVEHPMRKD